MINKELFQIIEADKNARNRISDASELTNRINTLLEQDRIKFEKKYSQESNEKIEEINKNQQNLINKSKEEYAKKLEEAKDKIEKLAQDNTDKWIFEIVCNVTGAE